MAEFGSEREENALHRGKKAAFAKKVKELAGKANKKEQNHTCPGCGAYPQGFKGKCDSCLGKN